MRIFGLDASDETLSDVLTGDTETLRLGGFFGGSWDYKNENKHKLIFEQYVKHMRMKITIIRNNYHYTNNNIFSHLLIFYHPQ